MPIAALIGPAIQFGVPAAIELIKLGSKWVDYFSSDEGQALTQEEFNVKWAQMQAERETIVNKHKALKAQGK